MRVCSGVIPSLAGGLPYWYDGGTMDTGVAVWRAAAYGRSPCSPGGDSDAAFFFLVSDLRLLTFVLTGCDRWTCQWAFAM